jgi:hypothetical protein
LIVVVRADPVDLYSVHRDQDRLHAPERYAYQYRHLAGDHACGQIAGRLTHDYVEPAHAGFGARIAAGKREADEQR